MYWLKEETDIPTTQNALVLGGVLVLGMAIWPVKPAAESGEGDRERSLV